MRISSPFSLSAAVLLGAALLSLPSIAKAETINSGSALVTFANGTTGVAINSTTPYANVAADSNFVTYMNGNAPAGNTTYSTSFSGFVGEFGTITLAGDDITTAFLNGFTIGNTNSSPVDTLLTFDVPAAFFVNGTNVLSLLTFNSEGPTGVDFSFTAITPEPSSIMLLGTGVVGLAGAFRRRLMA